MWLFKKVGLGEHEEYQVGYLTSEQRHNGNPESRFSAQVKGLDFVGAVRLVHYLNGGESSIVDNSLNLEEVPGAGSQSTEAAASW